jgi:hypothetical protein
MHTALVGSDGSFFLCGSGPAVPPFISSSSIEDAEADMLAREKEREEEEGKEVKENEVDSDVAKGKAALAEDDIDLSLLAVTVAAPRRPSASWLGNVSTRRTLLVAGSGTRCLVLQDDETVSASLTSQLLRRALVGPQAAQGAHDGLDDMSLDSHAKSDAGSVGSASYFEQRGRVDMMLIAAGKVLLGHRALLAQRSPELRDMIAVESPTDDADEVVTQVLLPELQAAAAKALLSFLYTDTLPAAAINDVSLLRALVRAGKTLRIPRLQLLAERMLRALTIVEMSSSSAYTRLNSNRGSRATARGEGRSKAEDLDIPMPPPTLARDLSAMVGDPLYADVRFVAEGRAIVAHR